MPHDLESGAAAPPAKPIDEIEITRKMIEAGEAVVWSHVSGAESLWPSFSAQDLATEVFLAMDKFRKRSPSPI